MRLFIQQPEIMQDLKFRRRHIISDSTFDLNILRPIILMGISE